MGGTTSRGATTRRRKALQGVPVERGGPTGKKIDVINSGLDANTCKMLMVEVKGMEGANCAAMARDIREQAVDVLNKETGAVTVVQLNKGGGYW